MVEENRGAPVLPVNSSHPLDPSASVDVPGVSVGARGGFRPEVGENGCTATSPDGPADAGRRRGLLLLARPRAGPANEAAPAARARHLDALGDGERSRDGPRPLTVAAFMAATSVDHP